MHDGRGDHENDQQHECDVYERRHVDVGVERQLAVSAQPAAAEEASCHQIRPSRASVPTISWAKPSSSPANRPRRLTKRLYAITAGTGTAGPPPAGATAAARPGARRGGWRGPPRGSPRK